MKKFLNRIRPKNWFRKQSLLTRYFIIILAGILFIPIIMPLASISYLLSTQIIEGEFKPRFKYGNTAEIKDMWYAKAIEMEGKTDEYIHNDFEQLKKDYPEASFFWVDEKSVTRAEVPEQVNIPATWAAHEVVNFMKNSFNNDPYTIIAYMGKGNKGPSFMVMQIPRELVTDDNPAGSGTPYYVSFVLITFILFITVSLLFFRGIRRRLLHLQDAMVIEDEQGIPQTIKLSREDEIGALEQSFNGMIEQMRESKARQTEEEELRKTLIANLSHDLRTPLTIMNGHLYGMQREQLTEQGQQSLKVIQEKSQGLGELIDNLLAYTLMTSGRYSLTFKSQDVLRIARESAASWYPIWEKANIEADIDLPDMTLMWRVDKAAFQRVVDNLFQNIIRHAAQGRYVGLFVEEREGRQALVIVDRGPGIDAKSDAKGAGIGMAIINYLIKEMKLDWSIDSSPEGSRISIYER
ncbi:HAMP domain-containing histidine kinase [Paenibacillus sp. N1-5-1-14]|uniref:sensor histidine kinase n=1 Tax=Paenibacillus radicibacter TaxID=2972488 RepID=UPI00215910EF|nr:HAMP domain-containing sensor histidine kinase [Paenibacillus radicibacter]MCR8645133.1 HAMP domain-containing histidine kinase [Paenibacillus radicibacter]